MGCGCSTSKNTAEDPNNKNQQQQSVDDNKNNNTAKKTTTTTTKKVLVKKKSFINEEGKKVRSAPPKKSPFPDPILKELPWHSLRSACDTILAITDDEEKNKNNATTAATDESPRKCRVGIDDEKFKSALSTITTFRSQCGLFFLSSAEQQKQQQQQPSYWKGRGYLRSGSNFVEEEEIYSKAEKISSYTALCQGSLALDQEDLEAIMTKLSDCLDVILVKLFSSASSSSLSLFVPIEKISSTSTSPITSADDVEVDYTRSRTHYSSVASSVLKVNLEMLAKSNNISININTTNQQQQQQQPKLPDAYGPMTPSFLDFVNNNVNNYDEQIQLWNLICQCVETVVQISKIIRLRGNDSNLKKMTNNSNSHHHLNMISYLLVQAVFRFTGDYSAGMCSVMKLEEVLEDIKTLFACLGILPSSFMSSSPSSNNHHITASNNNNNSQDLSSHTLWFSHLPISTILLSPQAVSVLLYCGCILLKQQRLDLKNLERNSSNNNDQNNNNNNNILDQLEDKLKDLAALTQNNKNYLYKTSFRLSPLFKNEAGEGHGPRKDFYSQCCSALVNSSSSSFSCFVKNPGTGTIWFSGAVLDQGKMVGDNNNDNNDQSQQQQQPVVDEDGFQTIVPKTASSSSSSPSKNHNNKNHSSSSSATTMTLVPFNELFSSTSPSSTLSPEFISRRCFTMGWLLGSAVVNGVTLVELPLPSVFFKILQKLVVHHHLVGDSSSSSSASTIHVSAIIPSDFTEQDLIEVSGEDMENAIKMVKKMKTVDELVAYCEGCIIEEDNDEQDDVSINAFDDALNNSKACNLKTTLRLVKSSSSSDNSKKAAQNFIILRHIVFPALFEDYRKRWVAVAAGFRASIVPIATPSSFLISTIDQHQLQGAITGGAADSLDSIEKDFSFANSFTFNFDKKEFNKFRCYFAFKNVITEALDLDEQDKIGGGGEDDHHNEQNSSSSSSSTSSTSRIDFKRKMLQFITGRKLVPSSSSSSSSSSSAENTITVALVSSPTTGWNVQECISRLSRKLPTAHTCTNTLEIPNYMEAAALEHLMSPSMKSASFLINPTTAVDDAFRERMWDFLGPPATATASSSSPAAPGNNNNDSSSYPPIASDAERKKVRIKARGMMLKMMRIAAYEGQTFELDETESTGDRDRHYK